MKSWDFSMKASGEESIWAVPEHGTLAAMWFYLKAHGAHAIAWPFFFFDSSWNLPALAQTDFRFPCRIAWDHPLITSSCVEHHLEIYSCSFSSRHFVCCALTCSMLPDLLIFCPSNLRCGTVRDMSTPQSPTPDIIQPVSVIRGPWRSAPGPLKTNRGPGPGTGLGHEFAKKNDEFYGI